MREYYHAQENRGNVLKGPIKSVRKNAWLGKGYYFWRELIFAEMWGKQSKSRTTGTYQIYSCIINDVGANVIDTVFNEDDYYGWVDMIEFAAEQIIVKKLKTKRKITIRELNNYFLENGIFKNIKAIIFQDVPVNNQYTVVEDLYYRKRIQIVV